MRIESARQASPGRRFGLFAALLAGVALALWLAFAAQLVFAVSVPWNDALAISFQHWQVPFGVMVVGAALTAVAPLDGRHWLWATPVHLLACAVVLGVAGQVEDQHVLPARPPGLAREAPPGLRPVRPGDELRPAEPPPAGRRPRGPGGPQRHFLAMLVSSRWQLHLAVYWVSVSLASAWRLRQQAAERERRSLELSASLSQAKLEALRLQLQPHFLFNTLNTIATLVHKDPAAADEMITNLSELLRLALDASESEVSLRRELNLVDRYLAIEHGRLGERLRVDRSVAADALDAAVPPLMLQTLVENAVRHGIEPRRAPGTVTISAARSGGQLQLSVADDGIGLPPADERSERRGVGLANTEARLRELHGDAARVIFRAPPEGGTRVEITMPWKQISPPTAAVANA